MSSGIFEPELVDQGLDERIRNIHIHIRGIPLPVPCPICCGPQCNLTSCLCLFDMDLSPLGSDVQTIGVRILCHYIIIQEMRLALESVYIDFIGVLRCSQVNESFTVVAATIMLRTF